MVFAIKGIPGFRFWFIPFIAGITAFIVGKLFWDKSKEADKLTETNEIAYEKRQEYVNVTENSIDNVGKSYASGIETTINKKLKRWWDVNLIGTAYDYRIKGNLYGEKLEETSFNWNLRFNNSFTLTKNTKFQFNSSYTSPTATAQGEMEGFFLADIALRQEFWYNKLSATLQISDVFATGTHDLTTQSSNMFLHSSRLREAPIYMLNLSFNINNYKSEKKKDRNNGGGDMEEEF